MAESAREEINRLERLFAAHPDSRIFLHLAEGYRRNGRLQSARAVLEHGVRRHGDDPAAFLMLGRVLKEQGEHAAAATAFRRVLQMDSGNHAAAAALTRLSRAGEAEPAVADEQVEFQRWIEGLGNDGDAAADAPAPADPGSGDSTVLDDHPAVAGWWDPVLFDEGEDPNRTNSDPGGADVLSMSAHRPGHRAPAGPPEAAAPPAGSGEEGMSGGVVTETMGDLYARQGLLDHAANIYRELLADRPGDRRLEQKLARCESRTRPAGEATIRARLGAVLAWRPILASDAPAPSPPRAASGAPLSGPPPALQAVSDAAPSATEAAPQPATEAAPQPATEAAPQPATEAAPSSGPAPPDAGVTDPAVVALIAVLVGLLEYRHPVLRGTSTMTRRAALAIGEELALDGPRLNALALGALLRDIGRIALDDESREPGGGPPATASGPDSQAYVEMALSLLEGIALPAETRQAVRHHRERWDGTGYPDELAGKDIPLTARILAVADAFAARLAPRTDRLPPRIPAVVDELRGEAGTQFDPRVVDALARALDGQEHRFESGLRHPILIVHPDRVAATTLVTRLANHGYLAEVCGTLDEARARLARARAAAVLVDGRIGSDRVAALIRGSPAAAPAARVPVVAMDVDATEDRIVLLETGVDLCLRSDASFEELRGSVAALIRRARREAGPANQAG